MATSSQASLKPPRIPSYCHHRASGQAYVKVQGKVTYLGLHGTEASRDAYASIITALLAGRALPAALSPKTSEQPSRLTVRDVCDRFSLYSQTYYSKNGKPTAEAGMVATACGHAARMFGDQPAEAFGPLALKTVRSHLVDSGLARSTINGSIRRICRAFKWAAGEELIPASVHQALATVGGLRAGRTNAREPKPILPIENEAIELTLSALPVVVADMVSLQRLTGMRPGEVCSLRPCDLDRSAEIWTYRPESHKSEHHGRDRVIFIGPKAQTVLSRYLVRDPKECCFRPCDSEAKRRAEQHASRVTPISCGNRPGTNISAFPSRKPGNQYSVDGYRQAIQRACDKAGVERWSPNRLRHSTATEVRAKFGLEAAQVMLGHSGAAVTQIYAERDLAKGVEVARQIG